MPWHHARAGGAIDRELAAVRALYVGWGTGRLRRLITDRATYAYLADAFAVEHHWCRGLGKFLIASVLAHQDLR